MKHSEECQRERRQAAVRQETSAQTDELCVPKTDRLGAPAFV